MAIRELNHERKYNYSIYSSPSPVGKEIKVILNDKTFIIPIL
jgi:hypothetical protein